MNLLDKLIQSLNKTTESIHPQPDCWITSVITDSTVISELEYYIEHADSLDLSQPNQAYGLLIVLEGVYSEKSIELQNTLFDKLKFSLF